MNYFKKYGGYLLLTLMLVFTMYRCSINKTRYEILLLKDRTNSVDYGIIDSMLNENTFKIIINEHFFDKNEFDSLKVKERLND